MALCAILSLVISLPSLRVRGEYFVVASLGLQMIAFTVFSEWKEVTGGLGGITGVPVATLFGFRLRSLDSFLAVSLVCLAFVTVVIYCAGAHQLRAQPEGHPRQRGRGRGVRQESDVHQDHCGRDLVGAVRHRGRALRLPRLVRESGTFTVDQSVLIMAMIIIGGTGTVFGPILGALIIHLLPAGLTYLTFLPARELASLQQIIYGAAMVLLMIYRPSGLIGRANVKDTWSK